MTKEPTEIELLPEEQEIEDGIERGEWRPKPVGDRELGELRKLARAALRKEARVSIRLTQNDLDGLREKAADEGMPYQTLISSVLHRYVVGSLRDSSTYDDLLESTADLIRDRRR